jgi:mitochondrial import inner membrane translocase subunit TIM23|eukprot:jgi/Chrpa1/6072/Chrysochromulina_OHIO_Genome00008948-RA
MSGNNSEGLMHDPYASSGSSGSLMTPPPLPSADDFHPVAPSSAPADDLFLNIPSAKPPQPDFLYDENYDESFRRSWGERLTYHVGAAYSAGFLFGTSYGLVQGLAESKGQRQRIRINSVLNSMGMSGPGLANSLGCIALMCSFFESVAYNVRGTDDILNPAGAAALTGVLYKSTSGARVALPAGLGFGALAALGAFCSRQVGAPRYLKNLM